MNKWESWPKAFEAAGKSNDSNGSQRLTLDLPPAEFAKALRELDRDREGISAGDSRYQAACALGELTWFDEMGRCVSILRHGSLVSKYEADGKERRPEVPLRLGGPPVPNATQAEVVATLDSEIAKGGAPGPGWVGPPAPPPGDPALPPDTGKVTFAGTVKAMQALLPKGKKK